MLRHLFNHSQQGLKPFQCGSCRRYCSYSRKLSQNIHHCSVFPKIGRSAIRNHENWNTIQKHGSTRCFFQNIQKVVRSIAEEQMESDENSRRETQVNRAAEQREREEQLRMEDVWPIASGLLKEKVKTKNVPAAAINLGADNDELDIFDPSNGRDRPNFYSFASGKDPKREEWLVNRQLYPHIRACITSNDFESEELAQMDTDLSICTLGTGSGAGTQLRSNPSTAIRYLGETIIIDAGEGLQKHILPSRVSLRYIRKILVTHMHGDHIFGLPGMLLALQLAAIGAKDARQVDVYGPVGIYNYIAASINLSCSELKKLIVHVHELVGGTMRSSRYAANRNSFAEFGNRGLVRKELHQNKDGTWILEEPLEITTPELAAKHNSQPQGLFIRAAELHHVPQLQCFGYTVQEPNTLPRKIDATKAAALGVVADGKKNFSLLKSGFPVIDKDGDRTIYPEEVLVDERRRPRKITVLGDCCMVPPAMQELAMDSDVLVHEATNSKDDETGKKGLIGGHSSASQAALFANKVRAKVLLLNHLGTRIDVYPGMRECIKEAIREITGPTKVQLCFDHMELCIPRKGFDFAEKTDSVNHSISEAQKN